MISESIVEETGEEREEEGTVNRLRKGGRETENGRCRAGCGSSLSEGSARARGPSKVILARSRRVAF